MADSLARPQGVPLMLLLYSLRCGEVLRLRWRDVDTDDGAIRIRQQVQRMRDELLLQLRQIAETATVTSHHAALLATTLTHRAAATPFHGAAAHLV